VSQRLRVSGVYSLFLLGLIVLIGWGALRDVPPIPKLFSGQDKLEHFLAFSALMLWLAAFLRPSRWKSCFLLAVGMALGLELAQAAFSVSRTASIADFAASLAGITLASVFIVAARRSFTRSARSGS
jgi:VanZ family protein